MKEGSLTLKGGVVLVLAFLLKTMEVDLPHPELAKWVDTTLVVIGAIIVYYGRWRHGDITWYGMKK